MIVAYFSINPLSMGDLSLFTFQEEVYKTTQSILFLTFSLYFTLTSINLG